MITQPISLEKAKEISVDLIAKLHQTSGFSGFVAGGFLRDAHCGQVAKDVDMYISTPNGLTEEQLNEKVKAFYDSLGYEFELHQRREGEQQPRFGDAPEYPIVLRVYSTTKCPEDCYPVDLVFTPVGLHHPARFDINLCNITCNARGRINTPREFMADVEGKTLTLSYLDDPIAQEMRGYANLTDEQFEPTYRRLSNHISRIKAKYPDHAIVFSDSLLNTDDGKKAYLKLVEDGTIGDPRAFFQAKRQEPVGDEVRFEDGDEAAPVAAIPHDPWARGGTFFTDPHIIELLQTRARMETIPGWLRGGTQVQPGPHVDIAIVDDVEAD